jgi:glycosyltransferase involved in cell wall biosynthesis
MWHPVIAFGRGGALETIRGLDVGEPTGVFFSEQSSVAIRHAVHQFEQERNRITALACRANAMRFAPERFRKEFRDYVEQSWNGFQARLG